MFSWSGESLNMFKHPVNGESTLEGVEKEESFEMRGSRARRENLGKSSGSSGHRAETIVASQEVCSPPGRQFQDAKQMKTPGLSEDHASTAAQTGPSAH